MTNHEPPIHRSFDRLLLSKAFLFWNYLLIAHPLSGRSIVGLKLCLCGCRVCRILFSLGFRRCLWLRIFKNSTFLGLRCRLRKLSHIFVLRFQMSFLAKYYCLIVYLKNLGFWNEHLILLLVNLLKAFFIENADLSSSIVRYKQTFRKF